MQERKYDTAGRDLLRPLCVGDGLDVGCNCRKIRENCIGVDIDASVRPDYVAPMDDMPFSDLQFDFVVGSHILEHAPSVLVVLREWVRVLRDGGVIGVCVPHGEYAPSTTLGDASGTHHQLFTPKTLRIFFEHVGLSDVLTLQYQRPYAYKQTPGIFAKGYKL